MIPSETAGLGSGTEHPRDHRTGVYTLLFSDVAGSTHIKAQLGDQRGVALIQWHHAVLRRLLAPFSDAEEINTAGDSFLIVFTTPSDALRFALQLQIELVRFNQDQQVPVQDRLGLHMGEVVIKEKDGRREVHGMQVDTCARVMSMAQPGQILMTRPVFDNGRQSLKGEDIGGRGGLEWLNHGRFELKGVEGEVEICEVRPTGVATQPPPTTSEKARRVESVEGEAVLGWRPATDSTVPNTHWCLEQKLGEGGFGEVWLAVHPTLKQRRVFKFCFRADRVRALKREVTLFRLLQERIGEHPNVVRLYEVFFDHPPYYLEEEYLHGRDLRNWCDAQGGVAAVPLETRLELVAQAATGLQAAHDAGVIHRDVKPGNILVSNAKPDGHQPPGVLPVPSAKLTDFGIGQVISEELLKQVTATGFTQTMVGPASSSHSGTQLYMAPELLAGKPASTRSDIYSLGVVLYQLIVGDFGRPVTTDWAMEIDDPLLQEDLQHCFAGNPEERFAGAAQLAKSLRALPQRRAESIRRQTEVLERERLQHQAQQRRRLMVLGGAVTTGLLFVAIALGYGMRKAEQQRQIAESARQLQRRYAYAADMKAAQVALQQNNRGMTIQLLNRYLPKSGEEDLRGLEWRYLWHESKGDELFTFSHPAMVKSAGLSPNDRYLATVAMDCKVRVWDLVAKTKVRELHASAEFGFRSVSYSPDGKWLAFPGPRGLEIRETSGWGLVTNFGFPCKLVCFGSERPRLAAIGENAMSWNPQDGSLCTLSNIWADFGNLVCTADGTRVAFWPQGRDYQGQIQIWDVAKGSLKALGQPERVVSLAISKDSKWLAAGNRGGEVLLWDLATSELRLQFRAHRGLVYALAFSPDSQLLATGGNDQMIRIWQCGTSNNILTLHGHTKEIWSLAFSSDGTQLVSSSEDGTAKIWSPRPVFPKSYPLPAPENCWLVQYAPGQNALVFWDWKSKSTLFQSLPDGELKPGLNWTKQLQDPSRQLHIFRGPQPVVASFSTNEVRVFDLFTQAEVKSCRLKLPVHSVLALSPDRRWLLGADSKQYVLHDLENSQSAWTFTPGWNYEATFSSDSRWLACAGPGPEIPIIIWDLLAGREYRRFARGHTVGVGYLAFSPDAKLLASGSWDGDILLWSLATGKPVHPPLRGHQSGAGPLWFSLDCKSLISGGDDFSTRVWSVATGQEMLLFEETERSPLQGELQGGKYLLLQQREGPLRVTPLPSLTEIDQDAGS